MTSITGVFVRRPVLAVALNLVLVLFGARALFDLPLQQYPRIESSSVQITTGYWGASAETVRGFVTTPIERAVSGIGGLDFVSSTSRANVSSVTVQLALGQDSTRALAEISARLAQVRSQLPAKADPPWVEVRRADRPWSSFYLSFTSRERSTAELTDWLARSLQPEFATLPGVQRVTIDGGHPLALRVWIEPERLAALGLTPGDVQLALERNNYLATVGQAQGNLVQVNLLTNTDLRSLEEFQDLIVADREGALVRLSDVARIELGAEEPDAVAKVDAADGVYLSVWSLPGSNEIELAHRLRREMARLAPALPPDIDMQLQYDATAFMEDSLAEVSKTLLETIGIVGLVVFLFLGSLRSALVPLVAMPISLVGAAAVMAALGFSLNLLTMLALVLSVGLVVDDAIVVVEDVERHLRAGRSRTAAALEAGRELLGPIVSMTVTLIAVYAPIGFQGGLTGALFLEFAITLAAAVLISAVVAVTLSPVMSAYLLPGGHRQRGLVRHVQRGFERVRAAYAVGLGGALAMRGAIVVVALLVLAAAWPLLRWSRRELAPVEDQSHISLFYEAAPDSTLASVERETRRLAAAVMSFPEADSMWSLTSAWGGFGGMNARSWRERERSTAETLDALHESVSKLSGLQVYPRLDSPLPSAGEHDVELVLQGAASLEQMRETAAAVVEAGARSGAFLYTDSDLKIDLPETRVVLDRERVADLGLDPAAVGQELGTLLGGLYVNRFNYFDQSYKVIPQLRAERRATPEALLDLKLRTPAGSLVPISAFARLQTEVAPRRLNRFQQRNSVRVFAGVKNGVTKDEGLRILEAAARSVGGPGLSLDYSGESRQIRQEGTALAVTLSFAIALIYLVLAAQFHSFRDPLIVLLGSVPLAISGALVFSFLDWTTINIYSQVGLITLVGLIAKNGILIVEFANALQERGLAKLDALREASLTRLRPVLMTSAATILGHFPLVLVSGPGAEARNSIGIVLVAGMAVGTLFTLFVVPVFYSLLALDRSAQRGNEAHDRALGLESSGDPAAA